MAEQRKPYSILSPLTIEEKIGLSIQAVGFFSPLQSRKNSELIEVTQPSGGVNPFDVMDFLKYLGVVGYYEEPYRHLPQVVSLVRQLASGHILEPIDQAQPLTGPKYYFLKQLTSKQKSGWTWLSQGLGAEFIHWLYSQNILHITGTSSNGDTVAGTGIAISSEWVLTCEHVLSDMEVDQEQDFGEGPCYFVDQRVSAEADVGLVQFSGKLPILAGLSFADPVVSESLFTIGFPRVPMSREAVPIMHRGEVTAPEIISFDGHRLFLYSAISRPGNSGGPIVSERGHIVGIVSKELSEHEQNSGLPFYAGVSASEIKDSIAEMGVEVDFPFEDFT